jgi:hypothetical protein
MTALRFWCRGNKCHTGVIGMTIAEIATVLRIVLVNCVNRDNGVSLAGRNKFFIGQRDCSDEEIISFWLSVSCLDDHRVPMFVVEKWAKQATSINEWMSLLERNTTVPENN